jgi:uncharacterized membrane protein YfcA
LLAGLNPEQIALMVAAALAASFVRGLSGFGMAILLVPILGLVISPQSAVVTSNLLALLIGLVGLRKVIGHSEASAKPIAILAMAATPAGLLVLSITDPALARFLIAIVAIAAFIVVLLPKRAETFRPHALETGATGIASGVLTGFAGMPGPPVIPYYLRRAIAPQTARASMMAIFLATSIAGSVAALALGLMEVKDAVLAAILFPAILIGNALGSLAFGKVSDTLWRSFAGLVLGAAAVGALIKLV